MPCYQPFRGDSAQLLLFKIASCLEAGGGGGGTVTAAQIIAALGCTPACEGDVVNSFNGQTGDVVLTLADISTLVDGRYVLKTGDTMTGPLNMTAGQSYQYNAVNVIRAQTALVNYFFGPSGNLTMTGTGNVSLGSAALVSNTSGINNLAIGRDTLFLNTTGSSNVAVGFSALFSTSTSDNSTAIGSQGLQNSTGAGNTGIGRLVLFDVTTGSANTAVGVGTGRGITTGSNNTILGANVTGLAAALSNNIIIADGAGVIRLQIDSSGNTTLAGTVQTAAGIAALPAFSFTGDPNTGLYNIGADSVGLSTGGTLRITTNTTDLLLATAFRLAMASGANTRAGNAVLVGGTVTVANTSVTANTIVLLTRKTSGGTIGFAVTYTVIAATSFTLTSDNVLDTSTYSYVLIENP